MRVPTAAGPRYLLPRNNPCLLKYIARYVWALRVTEDPHTQGGSAAHITTNGGGRPGSQNAGVAEHPLRGQPCANVSDALFFFIQDTYEHFQLQLCTPGNFSA